MTDADALQAVQAFLADDSDGAVIPKDAIRRVLTLATASIANAQALHELKVELAEVKSQALETQRLVDMLRD
jgi:hypothetical protein